MVAIATNSSREVTPSSIAVKRPGTLGRRALELRPRRSITYLRGKSEPSTPASEDNHDFLPKPPATLIWLSPAVADSTFSALLANCSVLATRTSESRHTRLAVAEGA